MQLDFSIYGWIMAMGFLVCSGCGWVGHVLILRKMALTGDALSHSILPGIVGAFLLLGTRSHWAMVLGALIAGMVTTFALNALSTTSRLKADAALAVVFSFAFALGILGISFFADSVDLDLDCVLFGDLAFVPLGERIEFGFVAVPLSLVGVACVWGCLLILGKIFRKEIIVLAFDPVFAELSQLPVKRLHYGFMMVLALIVVVAFEAVGAILVVGMLIFPGATAQLFSRRISQIHWLIGILSAFYAFGGTALAIVFDLPVGPAMILVASLFFIVSIGWHRLYTKPMRRPI
jgi:manganese/zinc/iron transport system permease protein